MGSDIPRKEHGGLEQQVQKNDNMERSFWKEQKGKGNVHIKNASQDIEEVDKKQGDTHLTNNKTQGSQEEVKDGVLHPVETIEQERAEGKPIERARYKRNEKKKKDKGGKKRKGKLSKNRSLNTSNNHNGSLPIDIDEATIRQWELGDDVENSGEEWEGVEDPATPRQLAQLTQMVENLLRQRGPLDEGVRKRIRFIILTAIYEGSITWGALQAAEWGGDWDFPPQWILDDEEFIRRSGGLAPASRARWKELRDLRMNRDTVLTTLDPLNPERDRVLVLAEEGGGVPIPVPDDFIPNTSGGKPGPQPSAIAQKVGGALRKMVNEGFHNRKLCFIIRAQELATLVPNAHTNKSTWAPKAGSKKGRPCIDCGGGGRVPGNQPLNSDWLKSQARETYDPIVLPTIQQFIAMIADFIAKAKKEGKGDRVIRIWKMDIFGAYTQLTFRADDVHLMSASLPGELIAFFMCGTFGWAAMPFAFQVISRAVVWELTKGVRHRLTGDCLMYVDDIGGISFQEDVAEDQEKVRTLVEGLLGPGAIAPTKTELDVGGALDLIGYQINISTMRVGVSTRNLRKAFYAAYQIGEGRSITLVQMQRVAAHCARYRTVCPFMAPFGRALFSACTAHSNPHTIFPLNEEQMAAVWMMRVLLILTEIDGIQFTRSIESFTTLRRWADWIIEYDACLTGIAIIWFKVLWDEINNVRREVAMGCWAGSLASFHLTNESGLMNTLEFTAGTIGIRGLAQRVSEPIAVMVRGDNTSAMTWAVTESYKSVYATRAAVVHVAQRVLSGIEVVGSEHLPHNKGEWFEDRNWRTDKPSRGTPWEEVLAWDKLDPYGSRLGEEMVPWEIEGVKEVLDLCNPGRGGVVDNEFVSEVLGFVRNK